MKILLTNPPWQKSGNRFGVRAGSRWPFTQPAKNAAALRYIPFPFFLAYATALIEREPGVTVKSIDAIAEGMTYHDYYRAVSAFDPDILFSESAAASFSEDIRHVRESRQRMKNKALVILGGPHVTYDPETTLQNHREVDFCLVGEYEWTLREVACGIRDGCFDPRRTTSLAYRSAGGAVVVNPRRPLGHVDELPWPAWHHYPMSNYRDYFCRIPAPMVNMMASRGCPFMCNFCLWPELMYGGGTYRARNATAIVDEMEALVTRYGFKTVYFDDDTFNIGKRRLLDICDEIARRKFTVNWAMMARADTIDEETLHAMRGAGLYAVKYGVESGNQRVLDLSGKKLDLQTVRRIVKFSRSIGIKVHLTFSIGMLGEDFKSIQDTIDLAIELDPDSLQASITTPFPGTRYYREAKLKGHLLVDDMDIFDGSTSCVVRTDVLSREDIEEGLISFQKAWRQHMIKRRLFSSVGKFIKKHI